MRTKDSARAPTVAETESKTETAKEKTTTIPKNNKCKKHQQKKKYIHI